MDKLKQLEAGAACSRFQRSHALAINELRVTESDAEKTQPSDPVDIARCFTRRTGIIDVRDVRF